MATLRDIRKRIIGVGKTQKITRAMKMVSAAKFARAQQRIRSARPYAEKLREVLGSVASGVDSDAHPLLAPRDSVNRLDVVVFTSDRGLCGAYNANICKHADALIAEREADVAEVRIVGVGRKVADYFRRRRPDALDRQWSGLGTVTPGHAAEIATWLMDSYRGGTTDEVVLVYSEFQSGLSQLPGAEPLLPVRRQVTYAAGVSYELEPSPEALLGTLVPRAVEFSVFRALLENQAGEHGARMSAMENATNNTQDLIRTLTIDFNKARQAAITAELVEIVSGAEAV